MNKKFLQLIAISIVVIMATLLALYENQISRRLYNLTVSQFSRHLHNNSILMTTQVRSDLLVNDLRTVRVKLGLFQRQGIIVGYKIIQEGLTVDEFIPNTVGDHLKFRQDIRFSDNGEKWGEIEYHFSTSILDEGFALIKSEIRYGLYFFMAILLLVIGASFSAVYYAALQVYPLLDRYISTMRIDNLGKGFGYVWQPLIDTLNESTVKYEKLRQESERNRRSALLGQITSQLTHDMRAPLGVFERLISTSEASMESTKPLLRDALHRLYAMVDSLRHGEIESIIGKKDCSLDFAFGYESLLGKAKGKGIRLKVPSEKIKSLLIDLPKVERAWVNLTSNALEFASSFVKVEAEVFGADLFIRVIDDGPGVPEEFLPRLFQRGATHGKEDGTGLGLAYVRQIMRGHGGDVSYKREGGMTIFECYLPEALIAKTQEKLENLEGKEGFRKAEDPKAHSIIQVSICFESENLNQRVYDRLMAIKQESYKFAIGFHKEADIFITNSEEISDQVVAEKKRLFTFDPSISHDEIVRRAPIRLGIRS